MAASSNYFDISRLSLGECQRTELNNPSAPPAYRQNIKYDNRRKVISTNFYQMQSLVLKNHTGYGYSINVPVEPWMRLQLNAMEQFVRENAKIPEELLSTYGTPSSASALKPFWPASTMYISLSKFCKLAINFEECGFLMDNVSRLKEGMYQMDIEFPYVYFGKHKENFLCSIQAQVSKVNYQCSLIPSLSSIDLSAVADLVTEPVNKKRDTPPSTVNELVDDMMDETPKKKKKKDKKSKPSDEQCE